MLAGLSRLSGRRFVIIGRAGMDIYPDPPGTRTEHATRFVSCLGGSSANIGVALVRLGAHADLVTCVSDDAVGRFALNELDRYGVGRAHVRSVGSEARNSLAVVETRVEDHQSVIYRNGAADFEMTPADVEAVDYAGYSALITTGTVLAAEPSRGATETPICLPPVPMTASCRRDAEAARCGGRVLAQKSSISPAPMLDCETGR